MQSFHHLNIRIDCILILRHHHHHHHHRLNQFDSSSTRIINQFWPSGKEEITISTNQFILFIKREIIEEK
ncbi:hypothetical protein DERP_009033 [Dermatophagoides pteronyssinus]|uniref:Uncharacterized protein n=1 Tax=Dermatophagoides pteronyssinus TaxID=6956 RepID=A0ABQ8JGX0_DERPT|nr:hypothetical protein DERP_009033 [Dermatophagoides pteronyssinus]